MFKYSYIYIIFRSNCLYIFGVFLNYAQDENIDIKQRSIDAVLRRVDKLDEIRDKLSEINKKLSDMSHINTNILI